MFLKNGYKHLTKFLMTTTPESSVAVGKVKLIVPLFEHSSTLTVCSEGQVSPKEGGVMSSD